MALIQKFKKVMPSNRNRRQAPLPDGNAMYLSFRDRIDGEIYFQINTNGSEHRENHKQSQTIQLNKESAAELIDLLKKTFKL